MRNVALVHDWLNQAGGAEVVLAVLHDVFPTAPVYTTIHDPERVPAPGWDVRVSWMNRLPGIQRQHQPYLPLYPLAWENTVLSGYDLVLSNKSGFCHGVRCGDALHVCYCLTPTRYVWELDAYLRYEATPPGGRLALRALMPALRRWDRAAAGRSARLRDRRADQDRQQHAQRPESRQPAVDLLELLVPSDGLQAVV